MGSGASTNRINVQITVREQGTQTENVDEDLAPVSSKGNSINIGLKLWSYRFRNNSILRSMLRIIHVAGIGDILKIEF